MANITTKNTHVGIDKANSCSEKAAGNYETLELPIGVELNASGHMQEVDRNFSLLTLTAMGLSTGASWPALGGSILVAIYNGGAPGVIYEFIVATICYLFIFASIAELASAVPSAAGVYHFASIGAGERWGKSVGFYAGHFNSLAWVLGASSIASIGATIIISMWALYHDDYTFARWHVFIVYLLLTWSATSLVAFVNYSLPLVNTLGLLFLATGVLITVIICAVLPGKAGGNGYASNAAVWKDWENGTGYTSDGFAFMLGLLNGAFAIGTPDITTHMSEEIPNPRVNVPKAMLAQIVVGFVSAFVYIIALFYSITDFSAIAASQIPFPLATIYLQSTNSKAGAVGLLFLVLLPIVTTLVGVILTASRILWTLGRDDATPYSQFIGHIDKHGKNPQHATLVCGVLVTLMGAIYVGSLVAFNAFVGSFVIFSTGSYLLAILPNLLTRWQYLAPGPFHMKGAFGYIVRSVACAIIVVFIVVFCFPYGMPLSLTATMNWSVVITGGSSVFIGICYWYKRSRGYDGPKVMRLESRLATAHESKHGEIVLES